jgi:phosphonate transport system substrate-binding protein
MRKMIFLSLLLVVTFTSLFAGGNQQSQTQQTQSTGPITMVWYPNESGEDLRGSREEFGKIVEQALNRPVVHRLTTDYAISIESFINNNAHLGWVGAEGYIQANARNNRVQPLVVPSGNSGTLDDAVYYSWLVVRTADASQYRSGNNFSIDNIQGRRFSFVSNSSTSGFRVPSAGIASYFNKTAAWSSLTPEDLLEGGSGKFFSQVLYGGSHQGSLVNILTGRADVGAVCDSCVDNYIELVSGNENRPGAVYRIRANADAPFDTMVGQQFTLISVTPVLNAPFIVNTAILTPAEVDALRNAFTAPSTAANERIFVPRGSDFKGMLAKTGPNVQFVPVVDSWFNPIRELSR